MNILPAKTSKLLRLAALGGLMLAGRAFAFSTINVASGDFFSSATWQGGLVPTNWTPVVAGSPSPDGNSWLITSNEIVTLDTNSPNYTGDNTGDIYAAYWQLGDSTGNTGTLIMNNGHFHSAEAIEGSSAYGLIGASTNGASFIMNGGTFDYDAPNVNEAINVLPQNTYLTNGYPYLWMTNLSQLQVAGNPKGWAGNSAPQAGVNGLTLEVGYTQGSGTSNVVMALHSNAVVNVANAIAFAAAGGGTSSIWQNATLTMDGNSQLNTGDGLSIGNNFSVIDINMTDYATLTMGNSMGTGNTNGVSNQGYWSAGSRINNFGYYTLSGHASIHSIMLKNGGNMFMLLTNNASVLIEDVLSPTGGTINYPLAASYLGFQNISPNTNYPADISSYNPIGLATIIVSDHALFSVDENGVYTQTANAGIVTNTANGAPTGQSFSNLVNGFSIGNGGYNSSSNQFVGSGANGLGGELIVKDYGTFVVKQSLHLATECLPCYTVSVPGGTTNGVFGVLSVVGPNATVIIGQDLKMGINLLNEAVPWQSAVYTTTTITTNLLNGVPVTGPANTVTGGGIPVLEEHITAPTQSTIIVTNRAWLTNGILRVFLNGYAPVGGETYTLVSAGVVDGLPAMNDFTNAVLSPGLVWNESATSTKLILQVSNTFNVNLSGTNAIVSWSGANGVLQSSTSAGTGYTDIVPTASSPYTNGLSHVAQYFRLRQNVTNLLNQTGGPLAYPNPVIN